MGKFEIMLLVIAMVGFVCVTSSEAADSSSSSSSAAFVKKTTSSHSIVIFSKSYCPYDLSLSPLSSH